MGSVIWGLLIASIPIVISILTGVWLLSEILSKHDSMIGENANHIVDLKTDLKTLRNDHDELDSRVTVVETKLETE